MSVPFAARQGSRGWTLAAILGVAIASCGSPTEPTGEDATTADHIEDPDVASSDALDPDVASSDALDPDAPDAGDPDQDVPDAAQPDAEPPDTPDTASPDDAVHHDEDARTSAELGSEAGSDASVPACERVATCAGNSDCVSSEWCIDGCCELRPAASRCEEQDQPCDRGWSYGSFFCDLSLPDLPGTCLAWCRFDPEGALSCADDQYCARLVDPVEVPFLGEVDGACITATCSDEDIVDRDFSCLTPRGIPGTCYLSHTDQGTCFEGGPSELGDDCDAETACRAGLFCHNDQCVEPCTRHSDCDGEERCVPAFSPYRSGGSGVCATRCEPYSTGQCPEGSHCSENLSRINPEIVGWSCAPVGEAVVIASGAQCDLSAVEAGEQRCAEGNACARIEGDMGICMRACDPLAVDGSAGDSCDPDALCVGSGASGGFCLSPCEPYPGGAFAGPDDESNGRWRDNGCPHDEDFVFSCVAQERPGDELACSELGPSGFCFPRPLETATGAFGADCDSNSDCNPDALCYEGSCRKLCLPNNPNLPTECPRDERCLASLQLTFSVCVPPVSGETGAACFSSRTRPCSADNSLCDRGRCVQTCVLDCEDACWPTFLGQCVREGLDDAVPSELGLCD